MAELPESTTPGQKAFVKQAVGGGVLAVISAALFWADVITNPVLAVAMGLAVTAGVAMWFVDSENVYELLRIREGRDKWPNVVLFRSGSGGWLVKLTAVDPHTGEPKYVRTRVNRTGLGALITEVRNAGLPELDSSLFPRGSGGKGIKRIEADGLEAIVSPFYFQPSEGAAENPPRLRWLAERLCNTSWLPATSVRDTTVWATKDALAHVHTDEVEHDGQN